MTRWWPQTLFGRMLLLLTLGLVIAQAASALIHVVDRQRTLGRIVGQELAQRLSASYRTIDTRPAAEQSALAASLSTPRLRLTVVPDPPATDGLAQDGLPAALQVALGTGVELKATALPSPGQYAFDVSMRLSAGPWLRVEGSAPPEVFARPWHLLINLALTLFAIVVVVAVAARGTARPLTDLAAAARSLSADLKQPPLAEDGPTEVREVARAFNAMQTRVRAGIEERERFLAAVSHDLKTPVTRLRLRTEMLADPEIRARFGSDIEDMQNLLDGALDVLQGRLVDEPVQRLDLVAMLESLADDYAGIGDVVLHVPEALLVPARPKALKRAIVNLIDNALKYGHRAEVGLRLRDDRVELQVEDSGPGIQDDQLDRVFEPFYRLEGSRSRDTGGSGLGLAIARQIARGHGGDVTLSNRQPSGLRATLWIPTSEPAVDRPDDVPSAAHAGPTRRP